MEFACGGSQTSTRAGLRLEFAFAQTKMHLSLVCSPVTGRELPSPALPSNAIQPFNLRPKQIKQTKLSKKADRKITDLKE